MNVAILYKALGELEYCQNKLKMLGVNPKVAREALLDLEREMTRLYLELDSAKGYELWGKVE